MSKESAIAAMQHAILRYINSRIPKDKNNALFGIVDGGIVHLADGRNLKYETTTDIYFGDGSKVACIVPDSSNKAAIVGVG